MATRVGHIRPRTIGAFGSFECATNGTEQNRKESAVKSVLFSFYISERQSLYMKRVVKVDREGRLLPSILPFD